MYIEPCIKCKSNPRVIKIDDMYYAQCPKCNKWDKFQFLGLRYEYALDLWNKYNSKSANFQKE